MIEHLILFSSDMVRAILDGHKTHTRRVVKPQPILMSGGVWYPSSVPGDSKNRTGLHYANEQHMRKGLPIDFSPYGQPGDLLWVKETFAKSPTGFIYRADWFDGHGQEVVDLPTGRTVPLVWKSSRFMPRLASRITLEIVNIRVERLQEITDDDAIQEGVDRTNTSILGYARTRFIALWNSIYYSKPELKWKFNPWVWVIEFKRLEPTP